MRIADIKEGHDYACRVTEKHVGDAIKRGHSPIETHESAFDEGEFLSRFGTPQILWSTPREDQHLHARRCRVVEVGVANGSRKGVVVELPFGVARKQRIIEEHTDGTFTHWKGIVYRGDPQAFTDPVWDGYEEDEPEMVKDRSTIPITLSPRQVLGEWEEWKIKTDTERGIWSMERDLARVAARKPSAFRPERFE